MNKEVYIRVVNSDEATSAVVDGVWGRTSYAGLSKSPKFAVDWVRPELGEGKSKFLILACNRGEVVPTSELLANLKKPGFPHAQLYEIALLPPENCTPPLDFLKLWGESTQTSYTRLPPERLLAVVSMDSDLCTLIKRLSKKRLMWSAPNRAKIEGKLLGFFRKNPSGVRLFGETTILDLAKSLTSMISEEVARGDIRRK